MKKLILIFLITINLVSFSLEISDELKKEIYDKGFTISDNEKDSVIISNSEVKMKIAFGRFNDDYVEKLKNMSNYTLEDVVSEEEIIEGNAKLKTKAFIFNNIETGVQHLLISCKTAIDNKNIEYILEIIKDKKEYGEDIGNLILSIPEEEIVRRIEKLIEVNKKYVGLLENEESSYEPDRVDVEAFGLNKPYKDEEEEGVIEKVDNFLANIRKYKATKKPFLTDELSVDNIVRGEDGFIYDLWTGELVSGMIIKRDHNGVIYYEEKVKDGLSDGKYNTYYINFNGERTPQLIGKYKKGVKEGTWKTYYENGEKKEIAKYNNGVLDGKYKAYYTNEELKVEGEYKEGQRTGEWVYYYQNGEKEAEGKYKEDEKIKKWKYYNINGKLREEKRHSFF